MSLLRTAVQVLFVSMLLLLLAPLSPADCPRPEPGVLVANPNRPTIADPADITQFGVTELEYGFAQAQQPGHQSQNSSESLLKFAATCNFEIRGDSTSFINQSGSAGTQSGIGDNWLGFQYRFHRQSKHVPSMAFGYDVKFPSASSSAGLGTGRYDQQMVFLASKDIKGLHFDFNTSFFRVGRQAGTGVDHSGQFNLAFSHPIHRRLSFTGEFYGNTQLGVVTPAYASGLWALTYAVSSRLVLDSGMDHSLTSGAPFQRRVFVGFTYSITDVYAHLRH